MTQLYIEVTFDWLSIQKNAISSYHIKGDVAKRISEDITILSGHL